MVHLYEMPRTVKFIETKSTMVVTRDWRRKEWGVTVQWVPVYFGGDEHVLELEMVIIQRGQRTKCH